jgi:hypothetical protein
LSLSSIKRLGQLGLGVGALALSVAMFANGTAYASGSGGTATPSSLSGGSAQTFSLALSGGAGTGLDGTNASCAADSNTGNTTFYSYLIPAYSNPGSEVVSAGAVSPGIGLYSTSGSVDNNNHNVGTGSGDIPSVTYSWVKTNTHHNLLQGNQSMIYEAGQLCWNQGTGAVTDWWNMEVTFTASTSDSGGFTWSAVPGPPSTPPATPESPLAVALPVGGGAVIVGALLFETRRRRRKVAAVA